MVITTDRNLVKIHLLCGRDSINEIWLIVRQYRRWMGVLGYKSPPRLMTMWSMILQSFILSLTFC